MGFALAGARDQSIARWSVTVAGRGNMKSQGAAVAAAVCMTIVSWAAGAGVASAAAKDPGVRPTRATDTFGNALPGLTPDQTTLFMKGQEDFVELEPLDAGFGHRFNQDSCVGCFFFL